MLLEKSSVIFLYFCSSVLTTIVNKQLIYTYNFPHHYLLIIIQSGIVTVFCLASIFLIKAKVKYSNIRHWLLTSIFLTLMIISNMKSIFYFDVSLYTLYKNTSIILVALLEFYFFKKPIKITGYFSFLLMIISSWTADLSNTKNFYGCLWMLLNIFSTAAYVLYLKFIMINIGTRIESVLFTNMLSIPLLTICTFVFDDFQQKIAVSPIIIFCIILSSVFAFLTAFSTAWTLQIISSTAYCMLGALNKVLLSFFSIFYFNESKNVVKIVSIFIGILGGFFYSYDSLKTIENEIIN
ncbi:hypothetical protein NUSPORA_00094 [Nucleospora cyclopteri]